MTRQLIDRETNQEAFPKLSENNLLELSQFGELRQLGDDKGFIKAGLEVKDSPYWDSKERQPFFLETSSRGVFTAGDVRSDSIKRVASAVGEGSMAVKFVHKVLSESIAE